MHTVARNTDQRCWFAAVWRTQSPPVRCEPPGVHVKFHFGSGYRTCSHTRGHPKFDGKRVFDASANQRLLSNISKPLVNSTLIALTYKDLDLSTWRDARFRTKYYDVTSPLRRKGCLSLPLDAAAFSASRRCFHVQQLPTALIRLGTAEYTSAQLQRPQACNWLRISYRPTVVDVATFAYHPGGLRQTLR